MLIELPVDKDVLSREVREIVLHAGNAESYIRIMITRGQGEALGLDPKLAERPSRFVIVTPLDVPPARVYGALTFFSEFRQTPPPETLVSWCSGPACYIKGGGQVRAVLEKMLGCGLGENTPDNKLGLHLGQCNGTCDNAPQVWVNGKVVGPLTAADTVDLVNELKQGGTAPGASSHAAGQEGTQP